MPQPCYAVIGSANVGTTDGRLQSDFAHYDSLTSAAADVGTATQGASTAVDLATGAIRLFGSASIPGTGFGANGAVYETIKFNLPDGMDGVSIPVSFSLHGLNTHQTGAYYNNISLVFQIASFGNAQHFTRFAASKACGFDSEFTAEICRPGEVNITYTGNITLWDDVYYGLQMETSIGGGRMTQDFTNTAGFSWVLPEGVTFQSGSGVFLTAPLAGVPEPQTWVLLFVGFGAVGWRMRLKYAAGPKGSFHLAA